MAYAISLSEATCQLDASKPESKLNRKRRYLFSAIFEDKTNDNRSQLTTCQLIKSSFLKAGVSNNGLDALELHSSIFHQVFLVPKQSRSERSGEQKLNEATSTTNPERDSVAQLTSSDYFCTLLDPGLQWFPLFQMTIPYLRSPLAMGLTRAADKFFQERKSMRISSRPHSQDAEIQLNQNPLQDDANLARLITSMLELSFSILLDWTLETNSNMTTASIPDELIHQFNKISKHVASCLQTLLDLLDDKLFRNSVESQSSSKQSVFQYLVEILALLVSLCDPLTSVTNINAEVRDFFIKIVEEKKNDDAYTIANDVDTISASLTNSTSLEFSETAGCESITIKKTQIDNSSITRTLKTDESSHLMESVSDLTMMNTCEFELPLDSDVSCSSSSRNTDSSFPDLWLLSFRSAISSNLFSRIVRYFSRGSDKSHAQFYRNLSSVIDSDNENVKIGRHEFLRKKLFCLMEKTLRQVTTTHQQPTAVATVTQTASVAGENNIVDADKEKVEQQQQQATVTSTEGGDCGGIVYDCSRDDVASFYPDRKLFDVSHAQEVVASGRLLTSSQDMAFLQQAVEEKMAGWCDLVAVGFQNHDYVNWWQIGFYELVDGHQGVLCTETNVQHLLTVLVGLATQEPVCWEYVERTTRLFSAMMEKLPVALQERVVLSGPFSSSTTTNTSNTSSRTTGTGDSTEEDKDKTGGGEKEEGGDCVGANNRNSSDYLSHLLGDEVVKKQTTQLLNRLTSDSVLRYASHMLLLCLYSREAVLTQCLQTAVLNKGQVKPVIQLLRLIPNMCSNRSDGKMSVGMVCLLDVLASTSTTQWDDKCEDNAAVLISQLTQGYTQEIQMSGCYEGFILPLKGVMSLEEIMTFVIVPSLDHALCAAAGDGSDKPTTQPPLPISATLKCLAALIALTPVEHLQKLHGIVLVQALVNLCIRLMPRMDYQLMKKEGIASTATKSCINVAEGSNTNSDSIYCSSRNCLAQLMDKMNDIEETNMGLQWLLRESHKQGGLVAVALVHPLVQRLDNKLNMRSILKSLVASTRTIGMCTVLTSLMSVGGLNQPMCNAVLAVVGGEGEVEDLRALGLVKSHLVSTLAQTLHMSVSVDIERVCLIIRQLVVQIERGSNEYINDWFDLMPCIDWTKVDKDCRLSCLCIQYISDALIWLLSRKDGNRLNSAQIGNAVTNYQTAVQDFMDGPKQKEEDSAAASKTAHNNKSRKEPAASKAYHDLKSRHFPVPQLVHSFVQCCSLMQHISGVDLDYNSKSISIINNSSSSSSSSKSNTTTNTQSQSSSSNSGSTANSASTSKMFLLSSQSKNGLASSSTLHSASASNKTTANPSLQNLTTTHSLSENINPNTNSTSSASGARSGNHGNSNGTTTSSTTTSWANSNSAASSIPSSSSESCSSPTTSSNCNDKVAADLKDKANDNDKKKMKKINGRTSSSNCNDKVAADKDNKGNDNDKKKMKKINGSSSNAAIAPDNTSKPNASATFTKPNASTSTPQLQAAKSQHAATANSTTAIITARPPIGAKDKNKKTKMTGSNLSHADTSTKPNTATTSQQAATTTAISATTTMARLANTSGKSYHLLPTDSDHIMDINSSSGGGSNITSSSSSQNEASLQTLSVLAMSILMSLTSAIELEQGNTKPTTSKTNTTNTNTTDETVEIDSTCKQLQEPMSQEGVLYLHDVVVTCVKETAIKQQLIKQLQQAWAVLLSNG